MGLGVTKQLPWGPAHTGQCLSLALHLRPLEKSGLSLLSPFLTGPLTYFTNRFCFPLLSPDPEQAPDALSGDAQQAAASPRGPTCLAERSLIFVFSLRGKPILTVSHGHEPSTGPEQD